MVKMKKIEKPDRHKSKKRSGRRPNSKTQRFSSSEESFSESELDLSGDLRLISDYVKNRVEMIDQIFQTVKESQLEMMLPDILKKCSLEELKRLCLDELEVMSKKRIGCILNDQEMTSSSESEEDSDEETEQLSKEKFSERENERIVECELPDSTTNPILASKSASPDSTEASFIQPTIEQTGAVRVAVEMKNPEEEIPSCSVDKPTKRVEYLQEKVLSQRLPILTEADAYEIAPDENADSPSMPRNSSTSSFGQQRQLRRFKPDRQKSYDEQIDLGIDSTDEDSVDSQQIPEIDRNTMEFVEVDSREESEQSSDGGQTLKNKHFDRSNKPPTERADDNIGCFHPSKSPKDSADELNQKNRFNSTKRDSKKPSRSPPCNSPNSDRRVADERRMRENNQNCWKHDRYGDTSYSLPKRKRLSPELREEISIANRYGSQSKEEKSWRWEHDDRTPMEEELAEFKIDNQSERGRTDFYQSRKFQNLNKSPNVGMFDRKRRHSNESSISGGSEGKFVRNRQEYDNEEEVEIEGSDMEEGEIRTVKIKSSSKAITEPTTAKPQALSKELVETDGPNLDELQPTEKSKAAGLPDSNLHSIQKNKENGSSLSPRIKDPISLVAGRQVERIFIPRTPSPGPGQTISSFEHLEVEEAVEIRLEPVSPVMFNNPSLMDNATNWVEPENVNSEIPTEPINGLKDNLIEELGSHNTEVNSDKMGHRIGLPMDDLYGSDFDSSNEDESQPFDPPPPGIETPTSSARRVDNCQSENGNNSEKPRNSLLSMKKMYEQLKKQKKLQLEKVRIYGVAPNPKFTETAKSLMGPNLPPVCSLETPETLVVAAESTTDELSEFVNMSEKKMKKRSTLSSEFLACLKAEQEKFQREQQEKLKVLEELRARRQKVSQNEREAIKLTIKAASLPILSSDTEKQEIPATERKKESHNRGRPSERNRRQQSPSISNVKDSGKAPIPELTVTRDQLKQKLDNLERSIEKAEEKTKFHSQNSSTLSQLEGLKSQAGKLRKALDMGKSGKSAKRTTSGTAPNAPEDSIEDQVKRKRQELELIELELRARAIRALMKRKEEEPGILE